MEEEETFEKYIEDFKNLPFSKSWENAFISNFHDILNTENGRISKKELHDFLYIPGINLLRYYGSDREFLRFRTENLHKDNWDYNLLENKTDNNNRRMAIFYTSRIMDALGINFMVDSSYGIYIEIDELAQRAREAREERKPIYKDIYNFFSIPKHITTKLGEIESFE